MGLESPGSLISIFLTTMPLEILFWVDESIPRPMDFIAAPLLYISDMKKPALPSVSEIEMRDDWA